MVKNIKIKCINNTNQERFLTIGKIYDTIEIPDNSSLYDIVDDSGDDSSYYKDRFINIQEERKEKLNKLNATNK